MKTNMFTLKQPTTLRPLTQQSCAFRLIAGRTREYGVIHIVSRLFILSGDRNYMVKMVDIFPFNLLELCMPTRGVITTKPLSSQFVQYLFVCDLTRGCCNLCPPILHTSLHCCPISGISFAYMFNTRFTPGMKTIFFASVGLKELCRCWILHTASGACFFIRIFGWKYQCRGAQPLRTTTPFAFTYQPYRSIFTLKKVVRILGEDTTTPYTSLCFNPIKDNHIARIWGKWWRGIRFKLALLTPYMQPVTLVWVKKLTSAWILLFTSDTYSCRDDSRWFIVFTLTPSTSSPKLPISIIEVFKRQWKHMLAPGTLLALYAIRYFYNARKRAVFNFLGTVFIAGLTLIPQPISLVTISKEEVRCSRELFTALVASFSGQGFIPQDTLIRYNFFLVNTFFTATCETIRTPTSVEELFGSWQYFPAKCAGPCWHVTTWYNITHDLANSISSRQGILAVSPCQPIAHYFFLTETFLCLANALIPSLNISDWLTLGFSSFMSSMSAAIICFSSSSKRTVVAFCGFLSVIVCSFLNTVYSKSIIMSTVNLACEVTL